MDEIADLLSQASAESNPDEEVLQAAVVEDAEPETDDLEDGIPFGGETGEVETEASEEAEDDEDDEGEEAGAPDDEPYLDVTDDDLIEVKVDGEIVYRSVADAKKALSGEGAIEKRLKEATQERNALVEQRRETLRQLEEDRAQLLEAVNMAKDFMFQPTVPAPDEQLRHSDPQAYLRHLDAYNADQARLNQARQTFQANMQRQQQEKEANLRALQQQNEQELMERVPDLRDPKKQQPIMQEIVSVARDVGFSDQEIASIFDARAYALVYELAQLRKRQGTVDVKKIKEETKKRPPRRLRSGVAAKVTEAKRQAKTRKADVSRARKTGKVDDVLRTIMK